MSVQRNISPDFRDPKICEFLRGHEIRSYSDQDDIVAARREEGFDLHQPDIVRLGNPQMLLMKTFRRSRVDLLSYPDGRLIRSQEIVDPIDHPIEFTVKAILFLRHGLSERLKNMIIEVLRATLPDVDAINDAETRIIQGGATAGDYAVDLSFDLRRTEAPKDQSHNLNTYLEQMRRYMAGRPPQQVYIVKDVLKIDELCDLPDNYFADDEVTPVADVDHPEREIEKEYEDDKDKPEGCDRLVLTAHRIGTAFQFYEWKTEWEVREIRVGRCRIMKTRIPVLYSRLTKRALWGVVMTEDQIKQNFERAIRHCLEQAALETAALSIVTGGLGLAAAAEAFANSFMDCIEQQVTNAVRCIVVSLKLVTEPGKWEEKAL